MENRLTSSENLYPVPWPLKKSKLCGAGKTSRNLITQRCTNKEAVSVTLSATEFKANMIARTRVLLETLSQSAGSFVDVITEKDTKGSYASSNSMEEASSLASDYRMSSLSHLRRRK